MARRQRIGDLLAIIAWAFILPVVVALEATMWIRVPLALLALVLPGYALLSALFPHGTRRPQGDGPQAPEPLRRDERFVLSFLVSVAIVPFVALLLALPRALNALFVSIAVAVVTVVAAVVAAGGRTVAARRGPPSTLPPLSGPATPRWALGVTAVIIVAAVGVGVGAFFWEAPEEHFTEFYVLGQTGEIGCYPAAYDVDTGRYHPAVGEIVSFRCPRQVGNVTVGIVNREGETKDYWIALAWANQTASRTGVTVHEFVPLGTPYRVTTEPVRFGFEADLPFDGGHETTIALERPRINGTVQLQLYLFEQEPVFGDLGPITEPYRTLNLPMLVKSNPLAELDET